MYGAALNKEQGPNELKYSIEESSNVCVTSRAGTEETNDDASLMNLTDRASIDYTVNCGIQEVGQDNMNHPIQEEINGGEPSVLCICIRPSTDETNDDDGFIDLRDDKTNDEDLVENIAVGEFINLNTTNELDNVAKYKLTIVMRCEMPACSSRSERMLVPCEHCFCTNCVSGFGLKCPISECVAPAANGIIQIEFLAERNARV